MMGGSLLLLRSSSLEFPQNKFYQPAIGSHTTPWKSHNSVWRCCVSWFKTFTSRPSTGCSADPQVAPKTKEICIYVYIFVYSLKKSSKKPWRAFFGKFIFPGLNPYLLFPYLRAGLLTGEVQCRYFAGYWVIGNQPLGPTRVLVG